MRRLVKSIDKYETAEDDKSLIFTVSQIICDFINDVIENFEKKGNFINYFGRDIDAACGQLFAEYDPVDSNKLFNPKLRRTQQELKPCRT
ncbi:hypothetical protein TOT_040000132 [Theileria orientalis strain Shintoku]|uniref:Uncharacterized protein n=1 Tax=Theileria orientalis strain Shintoku TaxID=869250 RepID=J4DA32_THEOR|nr:hypothetical protein TOT_040000132 [Theileria orientalis strain Shintoku]BAM41750.1 hypothetical protein TOT_040000132 [Theileria orientalis strain Shintoku]|eukprot:XP_009692051.1 hypothetical protein TOT_040000132 [Theileria orientalis strain Shintoku]